MHASSALSVMALLAPVAVLGLVVRWVGTPAGRVARRDKSPKNAQRVLPNSKWFSGDLVSELFVHLLTVPLFIVLVFLAVSQQPATRVARKRVAVRSLETDGPCFALGMLFWIVLAIAFAVWMSGWHVPPELSANAMKSMPSGWTR